MRNSIFFLTIVTLTLGFTHSHLYLKSKFNGLLVAQKRIQTLDQRLQRARLRENLIRFQWEDERQFISSLIPQWLQVKSGLNSEQKYRLRSIASVFAESGAVQTEDEVGLRELSPSVVRESQVLAEFEKAKTLFRSKEYDQSNSNFKDFIKNYSDSIYLPEAYFLLLEGEYQLNEYENFVTHLDEMLSLFPEHDLTGASLLRLALIYQKQDRFEDAVEIYRQILKSFRQPLLLQQAKKYMKALEDKS